ncbi:hypothetical protein ACOMHN_002043 [Nucella lapillus]
MASVSYEVNKFNPQPSAELLCAICFNVLHEACMCPCHHIFCDCCIRKWLENNHTCPTCRRRVNLQQLESAPPLVQNVLNSLTMDCDFKDEGCDQSILKENFPLHIGNCDFRPVSCPHKDCTNKTTARALADHTEECRYRSLQCPKRCKLPFPAHELERHDCFTALQDRVQELDSILHRHQLVLKWIRMKMNTMQVSNDPVALQLQAYRDLFKDINQYWPENQAFPLLLCGSYVAPAVPLRQLGNGLPASASSANEVDNSALEQLAAEADVQNMPGVFGPRDPDGAEGPTAHDGQDTPTRGVVYEEDIEDANDGSQKSVHPDTSQNVWESSSNTTSLDYDIAEELTPKPISPHDSGSDCNSPETEGKHTTDGISGKADQAQTSDIEVGEENIPKDPWILKGEEAMSGGSLNPTRQELVRAVVLTTLQLVVQRGRLQHRHRQVDKE